MNYLYFIIFILITIIFLLLYVIYKKSESQWSRQTKHRLKILEHSLGDPRYTVPSKEGYAVWKHVNKNISEVILYNEGLINKTPIEHINMITVGMKLSVNIDNLFSILSLSKIIWYNQLTSILYVRSSSLLICLETLKYIKNYITNSQQTQTIDSIFIDNYEMEYKNPELYFSKVKELLNELGK